MRIALCISGYFTNMDNDNLMISNYIYDNIINRIDKNNTLDIFIHSFDKKSELNINTKYPNTTKTIIEEQINFVDNLSNENKEFYNKLNEMNYNKNTSYNIQSSLSMMYSRSYVIKMALNYSTNNNFEYDVIIRVRFDIGIRMKKAREGYKHDNLVFDLGNNYNYNYFYSSYWNQLNAGYGDFWEFSNSKNMKIFFEIYNYTISNMFVLNSDYIISLTNNWYDSNKDNEFSNEMLNKHKNIKYHKYRFIDSVNNHLIQKFFMIKCNLYEKSAFIDFTRGATSIVYKKDI